MQACLCVPASVHVCMQHFVQLFIHTYMLTCARVCVRAYMCVWPANQSCSAHARPLSEATCLGLTEVSF